MRYLGDHFVGRINSVPKVIPGPAFAVVIAKNRLFVIVPFNVDIHQRLP